MTLDNNTNISACPDSKIQLSSVLGGKAPLTYTWKIESGANFVTPSSTEMSCSNCDVPTITVQSGTAPKAYRINTVDDRGCTFQNDIFVTSSALSLSIDPSSNTQACVGNSTALLKSIVSGGSGKYQYSWSPSNGLATPTQAQTALKAYDLYPTAYTVRVTDQYGCSQTAEARIQGSISTPVANAGNSVASACHGSNITLGGGPTGSGSDLVGGLSYKWSGPSGFTSTVANPVITDARFNMSGTYQVTVTDNGNGCYTTASVPVNILKEIKTQGFEALAYVYGCLGTNNTAFTSSQNIVTIGGESGATAPLNYYWTPSTIVSGFSASQVGSQYNFTNPTITPTATDRKSILTISDANGCTKNFPSREFLLSSQTPVINLNRISGSICTSKPVQFKLAIDYKFIELQSRVSIQYQIELDGVNVLTVLTSSGIYTSLPNYNLYNNIITVTPTFTGKHILKVKSISNNCGTSIFEYTFTSMSGGSTQTAICNNDNASLLGGVYQGSVVNVANGCIAEVKWGSEATIVASNSITMLPGFAANSGSIYEAKIAALNICPTNIIKEEDENSIAFNALNAYPTPFNDRITIEYKIENSDKSDVVISIIDMNGRVVDLLVDDKNKPQGYYKIDYNSTKLSSGNYFILMRINKISKFKKIIKIE